MSLYATLLQQYYDLNGTHIPTLDTPPTPIQFANYIQRSAPFLIRGYNKSITWTRHELEQRLGEKPIDIAITPDGYADAINSHGGITYFTQPFIEKMTIRTFFAKLLSRSEKEVPYLQSQNGNISNAHESEPSPFADLLHDIPEHIDFATEALQAKPDAVNIWIGNERSVTTQHADPYENLYLVIRGTKTFRLWPPIEGANMRKRDYPGAHWIRNQLNTLAMEIDHTNGEIPWSSVDPRNIVSPMKVTVNPGDLFFLPNGWYHHVSQSVDEVEQINISVNWWYDCEQLGDRTMLLDFAEKVAQAEMHKGS